MPDTHELSRVISVRPTITPAAYSAGDAIGTSVKLSGFTRADGIAALLRNVVVTDKDDQNVAIRIILFDKKPSTEQTDNAALNIVDADLEHVVAELIVPASTDLGGGGFQNLSPNSGNGLMLKTLQGKALWAQFVVGAAGSPTYVSADALLARFTVEQ